MNNHPLNLALRFVLELVLLYIFGYWAWHKAPSAKWLFAILLPLSAAALWVVFRVEGDPGKAIVPVSGAVRLAVEGLLFGGAICMLFQMQYNKLAWLLLTGTIFHYAISFDRIYRLLN